MANREQPRELSSLTPTSLSCGSRMRHTDVVNYFVEQVDNGTPLARIEDLRAVAKDGGHQPWIPAPVKNRDDPKRLLVWP
jgi:hypothetical protein